jgi:adenylate cyclase
MRTGFIGKIPAFQFWWKRRVPLGISFAVTATALGIYWTTFVGERPTPAFDFIHRLELASLDARFQLRGPALPDPRIVIVDIDQRSQEILGRWPFPRSHFAKLIEVLRASGARVVTFDITFSQMDESARPIHEMRLRLAEQQQKGVPLDPRLSDEFNRLEKEFAYDQRFAEAIQRFGKVVLGNFFLYTQADLRGLDAATLGRYAELLAYYPFPQVRATSTAQGPQSFVNLINNFESLDLLPRGAEANLHILTAALPAHTSATGFFNIFPDPDGVVRRALLALPYGRSARRSEWDLYASIDVQTVRFFLDLPDREVVLNYGKTGIESFQLGSSLSVIPDDLGRVIINYQGPVRTYPYRSLVDVINKGLPPSTFEGKIVLVGASATGIGDIRPTPYRGMGLPGVEVHANIIDNILNRKFLERGARQVIVDHALILLFGLPLGLWLAVVRPRWMPLALLLLLPFGFGIYFAFARGWWLNAVTPSALALIPNTGLVALYRVLVEEREKRRVRGAFQQYLSPEVIRRLLENPELVRPRKLEITLLFNDIRGFTSVS